MKKLVQKLAHRLGYSINRLPVADASGSPYSPLCPDAKVVDLERLAAMSLTVPGMVTTESGKFLYTMCVLQQIDGAVVEIGSWQGRSSSFLARAVAESGNGPFYAIDHFRGNVGKESFYAVGADDLSDLRAGYEANMRKLDLWEATTLLDMPNSEAAQHVTEPIRFLFIDGDHTREGVEKDMELFFPKLAPHAIVVFDDYMANFDGLVSAVNEKVGELEPARALTYKKTLVIQL